MGQHDHTQNHKLVYSLFPRQKKQEKPIPSPRTETSYARRLVLYSQNAPQSTNSQLPRSLRRSISWHLHFSSPPLHHSRQHTQNLRVGYYPGRRRSTAKHRKREKKTKRTSSLLRAHNRRLVFLGAGEFCTRLLLRSISLCLCRLVRCTYAVLAFL